MAGEGVVSAGWVGAEDVSVLPPGDFAAIEADVAEFAVPAFIDLVFCQGPVGLHLFDEVVYIFERQLCLTVDDELAMDAWAHAAVGGEGDGCAPATVVPFVEA